MASWWETVLSVGAGGGFVLAGQWLQAHFTSKREREARDAERNQKLTDEQRAYELARMDELRVTLGVISDSHSDAMRVRRRARQAMLLAGPGVLDLLEGEAKPVDEALAAEFAPAVQRLRGIALVVLDHGVREACLEVADKVPRSSDSDTKRTHVDEAYRRIGERTRELYKEANADA